jgi:hypothetical protein
MVNFGELEHIAQKYLELKQHKKLEYELRNIAVRIIDSISSSDFVFPIKKESVVSNGTTTYVYINNLTYPYIFEFIAEILHVKIPITINDAKFGPGEIIVNKGNKKEAQQELDFCTKELQKLIHAKKAKMFAK